uniref:ABC-2 type transporter transmembrane domain-containing protein n=1 Tax=Oryza brachyantha TaxID=4533 RepID=J3MIJ5_ORYBR
MSRMAGDLPMELALPTAFTVIVYLMVGLNPSPAAFALTLAVILSYVLVAEGLRLDIGAVMMDAKSASTLVIVIMLAYLLTGGFYVHNVPDFMMCAKQWRMQRPEAAARRADRAVHLEESGQRLRRVEGREVVGRQPVPVRHRGRGHKWEEDDEDEGGRHRGRGQGTSRTTASSASRSWKEATRWGLRSSAHARPAEG